MTRHTTTPKSRLVEARKQIRIAHQQLEGRPIVAMDLAIIHEDLDDAIGHLGGSGDHGAKAGAPEVVPRTDARDSN